MNGINTGKVLTGGLVAGLVANVIQLITNLVILRTDSLAMIERLGLDPGLMESPTVVVWWVFVNFLWGILLVFAYAAMRPRFGAGPRTAVMSGVTLYLAVAVMLSGFVGMGVFTLSAFVKSSACALIAALAASLAGAVAYRE